MADYKIELGVQLNKADLGKIKTDLNNIGQQKKIKLDINRTNVDKHLNSIRKQIQNLSNIKVNIGGNAKGGTGNVLNISTADVSAITNSFNAVKDAVLDIRKVLGTLDDGSEMKSLVSSINQIATSLGKATDESQNLVNSLNALSKKDFSFNFGFNMGKSASQMTSEQGDIRRDAISQLKQQAKALEDYFDQYYKVAQQGAGVAKLTQGTNVFGDYWELSPNIGDTKASLKQQVATYKQYIDLMQQAAKIKGVDLSGVVSGFSKTTDDIVNETKSATNSVEQFSQTLKGLFGGSIDSESLTQILEDLKAIKEALTALSSGTSLDGLTQSFNTLSQTLEKLTTNITTFKQNVSTGLSGGFGVDSNVTNEVKNIKSSFESAGKQAVKGLKKGVQDGLKGGFNLESEISKEVNNLAKNFNITGQGKENLRSLFVEARNESLLSTDSTNMFASTASGIGKITDVLLANEKAANNGKEAYKGLSEAITSVNRGVREGTIAKVWINDSIVSEFGDDFESMRRSLGAGFVKNKKQGESYIDFDTWIEQFAKDYAIDMSQGLESAFGDLVKKNQIGKGKLQVDDGYSADYRKGIEEEVRASIARINELEQASKQSESVVSQVEQAKRAEYDKTISKLEEVNRKIAESDEKLADLTIKMGTDNEEEVQKAMSDFQKESVNYESLEAEKAQVEADLSKLDQELKEVSQSSNQAEAALDSVFEGVSGDAKEAVNAVNTVEDKLRKIGSINIDIKDGIGIDSLKKELNSLDFNDASIKQVTNELEEMGVSIRKVTSSFNKEKGVVELTVNGTDKLGRAVTAMSEVRVNAQNLEYEIQDTGIKVSQSFTEIANAAQKIKGKLELNDSGFSKYDREIKSVETRFENLSAQSEELRVDINALNDAFDNIKAAENANDILMLVEANKKYEDILKRVKAQLEDSEQSQGFDKFKKEKDNFSSQMDVWLQKNSAAAKQFGDRVRELQAELKNCNKVRFNEIKQEFKEVQFEAEKTGKTGRKFGDSLKDQFKKFGTYFSVATLFMYAEQGLRSMFEQVKLIDSAMTELKKVTDETDASYEKFLRNAASGAKEIGTTIDGLVASTADFARLGYGFKDAQGLAEVANIYAVVGDEVEGVEGATQSLISTMAAFKDEMNGLDNTDFSMSIVDKMNEVGNNFAISSGGIGEALQRSASSMAAANNTLDETIALITAANTVVKLCHAA